MRSIRRHQLEIPALEEWWFLAHPVIPGRVQRPINEIVQKRFSFPSPRLPKSGSASPLPRKRGEGEIINDCEQGRATPAAERPVQPSPAPPSTVQRYADPL